VEFQILGPLRVLDAHGEVWIGAPKERALLAALLLHGGSVVSRDRLVDALWGEEPPPTAAKALNNHVSQLRRAIAEAGPDLIVTRPPGYAIEVEPEQLDAARFRALVAEARDLLAAEDYSAASGLFRDALALWRGPALDGIELEAGMHGEAGHLDELRLAAQIDRIDCELALGSHAELVPELEALVAEHPLRERLRAQLMLALYRSGRQAEALRCYRDARDTLVGELGIEPSAALQRLEHGILNHDPGLEGAAGVPPVATVAEPASAEGEGPLQTAPRRRPKRWLLAALAAAIAAGVSIGLLETSWGTAHASPRTVPASSVGAIDSGTSKVTASVSVPGGPERLAVGDGRVWATRSSDSAVVAVDTRRAALAHIVDPAVDPADIAIGRAGLFVLGGDGTLVRIDPALGDVAGRLRIEPAGTASGDPGAYGQPTAMAVDARSVWIADLNHGIVRVDPTGGRQQRFPVGFVNGLALGEGAIWAASGRGASVLRIDPRSGRVTDRIPIVSRSSTLAPYPYAIAVGAGYVWVVNGNTGTVTKIDPSLRGVVSTIPIGVGTNVLGIAAADGAAWVTDGAEGTLIRIDARSDRTTTIPLGPHQPRDVAVSGRRIWFSVRD
jgi:DNA-binding SARP family transcriptional activator/streptogramin lyase